MPICILKTMKKLKVILLLFVVFPDFVLSQSLDAKVAEIDAYAQRVVDTWKGTSGAGMAIAVVKDDKVVFAKGYGPLRIDGPAQVNENTVFAIASNSKAFTTAALAILVDEKKIAWDDKVSKYLPEFQMYDPWVTSELTIRDLVTHRVGLDTFSGDLLWYETTYSPDEILRRVRYLKPVSSFRTRFGYQNLMFIAAGKVVEKVAGRSWCTFVKERILTPLAMSRTTCSINDLPDNAAWPHNESGGKLRVLNRGNVDGSYSAAALNSSVADLSKWVRLQLGRGKFEGKQIFLNSKAGRCISSGSPNKSARPARRVFSRHFAGVGMGWFVYDYYGRKVINHSGGLDGMLSYTVLIPEENAGFVILTNSESPTYAVMMNKVRDILVGAPERLQRRGRQTRGRQQTRGRRETCQRGCGTSQGHKALARSGRLLRQIQRQTLRRCHRFCRERPAGDAFRAVAKLRRRSRTLALRYVPDQMAAVGRVQFSARFRYFHHR